MDMDEMRWDVKAWFVVAMTTLVGVSGALSYVVAKYVEYYDPTSGKPQPVHPMIGAPILVGVIAVVMFYCVSATNGVPRDSGRVKLVDKGIALATSTVTVGMAAWLYWMLDAYLSTQGPLGLLAGVAFFFGVASCFGWTFVNAEQ